MENYAAADSKQQTARSTEQVARENGTLLYAVCCLLFTVCWLLLQPEFINQSMQIGTADPEPFGCCHFVSTFALQRAQDHAALN